MRIKQPSNLVAGVIAIGIGLALAGCSAAPSAAPAQSSAPTRTSVPTPTPTEMTAEQAGQMYLRIVCPGNAVAEPLNKALQGTSLDTIHSVAGQARDLYRKSAAALVDPALMWPASLKADLQKISDESFAYVAVFDSIANSTSVDVARASAVFPDNGGPAAAQKVRAALGLSADTSASCKNIP